MLGGLGCGGFRGTYEVSPLSLLLPFVQNEAHPHKGLESPSDKTPKPLFLATN